MKSNAGGFVASTKSRTQSSKEKEFRRRRDVHLEDASSLVDSHKSTEAKSGLLASSAIHKPIKMWPKTVRWADDSGKDLHSFKEIPGRTSLKMNSKKAKEADAHLHGHHQDEVDDFGMGCIEAIMAIENYIQGQSSSCSKEEVKKIETGNQRKCSSDEENISPVKSGWMPRLNSIEIDQHLPEDNSSDMEMASTDEEEFIDPNDLDYDALLQSRGYCIPGEHGASRCVPSPVECSRDVNEIKEEVIMESSQASTSDASINGLMNLNALYNEATVDSIPVDISSIPYPDPIAAQDDLIVKVIANLAMAGSAPVVYNGGLEFGYTEVNPEADAHIHGQCQNEVDDFEKGCIEAMMAIENYIQGQSSSCSKEEVKKIETVNKRKFSSNEENISPVKSGWMPPLNSSAIEEDNSSDMELASSDGEECIDQNDLNYDATSKGYNVSDEKEAIRCYPSTARRSGDVNENKNRVIMESSYALTSDHSIIGLSNVKASCNEDPIMKSIAKFAMTESAPVVYNGCLEFGYTVVGSQRRFLLPTPNQSTALRWQSKNAVTHPQPRILIPPKLAEMVSPKKEERPVRMLVAVRPVKYKPFCSKSVLIVVDSCLLFGLLKPHTLQEILRRLKLHQLATTLPQKMIFHQDVEDNIRSTLCHPGTSIDKKDCMRLYLTLLECYGELKLMAAMDSHGCNMDSDKDNIKCLRRTIAAARRENLDVNVVYLTDLKRCTIKEGFVDQRVKFVDYKSWIKIFE